MSNRVFHSKRLGRLMMGRAQERSLLRTPIALCFALLLLVSARGQQAGSPHAGGTDPNLPQPDSRTDALAPAEQMPSQDSTQVKDRSFDVPDLPKRWNNWNTYEGRYFSLRFGALALFDYHVYWQDSNSIDQVGQQRDQWDTRSVRFMLRGRIGTEAFPIRYFVSYEFKGFDQDPGKKWGLVDLSIAVPAGELGALTIGKTKEPFTYEMVSDAGFLPQIERTLNSFFVSRNVGVVLNNSVLKKHMTYSAGWFNDWWVQGKDFSKWGNHFAGRVTGLVSINEEGSRYLHVGGSARYAGANDGSVRLRGQPESNVTDYYVDTLDIRAANQKELAFESLWNRDSCSLLFEYARSRVNAAGAANPTFYGVYITGSWIVTGEHHPYDRNVGFARRIIPRRTWGAVELEARYSRVDLSDKAIDGGLMNIGSLGLNWIPNRRWKIGLATNVTSLDRFGTSGLTNKFQARMQFVY